MVEITVVLLSLLGKAEGVIASEEKGTGCTWFWGMTGTQDLFLTLKLKGSPLLGEH